MQLPPRNQLDVGTVRRIIGSNAMTVWIHLMRLRDTNSPVIVIVGDTCGGSAYAALNRRMVDHAIERLVTMQLLDPLPRGARSVSRVVHGSIIATSCKVPDEAWRMFASYKPRGRDKKPGAKAGYLGSNTRISKPEEIQQDTLKSGYLDSEPEISNTRIWNDPPEQVNLNAQIKTCVDNQTIQIRVFEQELNKEIRVFENGTQDTDIVGITQTSENSSLLPHAGEVTSHARYTEINDSGNSKEFNCCSSLRSEQQLNSLARGRKRPREKKQYLGNIGEGLPSLREDCAVAGVLKPGSGSGVERQVELGSEPAPDPVHCMGTPAHPGLDVSPPPGVFPRADSVKLQYVSTEWEIRRERVDSDGEVHRSCASPKIPFVPEPTPGTTYRNLEQIRQLPFVPPIPLRFGSEAFCHAPNLPGAPPAARHYPEHQILTYMATLAQSLLKVVFPEVKKPYFAVHQAVKNPQHPLRSEILALWKELWECDFLPAEWMFFWAMSWKSRHPKAHPPVKHIISMDRISSHSMRIAYELNHTRFLRRVLPCRLGTEIVQRNYAIYYALPRLHAQRAGYIADSEVQALVSQAYPKGWENARIIAQRVHNENMAEKKLLLTRALAGEFVWDIKNL